MAEPKDAVMPVLRKIQDEIAGIREDNKALRAAVASLDEKLDDMDARMIYHLGLTSQHVHDIESINAKFKELTSRLSALESKS